ncbi:MAG: N-acetylmuramoyl-L-alanine amidase [Bdellovibrionota bacterium]
MKLKTAICLTSALTFSVFFSRLSLANFTEQKWIYHGPSGDESFEKCGGELGSPLVSLDEIQKKFELKRNGKKDFTLENSKGNKIRFSLRHNKVLGKDWSIKLSQAPELVKKKLCVPLDFGDRVLTPLLTGVKPEPWDEHLKYTSFAQVVLDPGHGGNDWGALGVYKGEALKEKDLTLEFSKEFERALKDKGVQVAVTRNRDQYVALAERYELANKFNSKLFISLHMNSSGVSPGFEIFTLSMFKRDRKALEEVGSIVSKGKEKALVTFKSAAKQELSIAWAAKFKKVMSQYIKPVNAGMRREPFFLLYAVQSPGILMELGYMDREEDLRFWLNKKLRKELWKKLSLLF